MNKITVFFRKYGHKILTFTIGLVFLSVCVGGVVLGGIRVYHMFRPAHIYEDGVDPDLISAGAAFDELRDAGLKEGTKEFFTQYIANFVAQDFPNFSDPVGLNPDYFISYGLWQAIKVNGQGVYSFRNNDAFLVPRADVEKYGLYNFNYAGKIKHKTVDICGKFTYDKLSRCYKVSTEVMDEEYLVPSILEVKKDEKTGYYTLLVDCYYSDPLTETDVTQDATRFAKRLSIVLRPVEMISDPAAEAAEEEAPNTVIDYQYVSCTLVDETLDQNK